MAHGLSCSTARGILPDQGLNPCPLHWQADSQPLCHQGSPLSFVFNCSISFWDSFVCLVVLLFFVFSVFVSVPYFVCVCLFCLFLFVWFCFYHFCGVLFVCLFVFNCCCCCMLVFCLCYLSWVSFVCLFSFVFFPPFFFFYFFFLFC